MREVDGVDRLLAEDVEAGGGDAGLFSGAPEDGQREGGEGWGAGLACAQLFEERAAVDVRQRDVADQDVRLPLGEDAERVGGGAGALHLRAAVPQ